MPTVRDLRAAAWKRMKEGGLLPLLAGFSLAMLLGSLVTHLLTLSFISYGWVTVDQIEESQKTLELLRNSSLEPTPEQIGALMPVMRWTGVLSLVFATLNFGILSFGRAVLTISVMRGGAKAFFILSGFRGPMLLRTAALGILRFLLVGLGLFLFVLPGILAFYSCRMAYLLLADNPSWSPVRALRESRRLMYGHRWRLFCLDAVFLLWIPLVLLGGELAAILILVWIFFVVPYFATATAAFYEDLLDRAGR